MHDEPLWTPDPAIACRRCRSRASRQAAGRRAGSAFADYDALHAWSVEEPGAFWDLVWDFCGVVGDKGERRLVDGDSMRETRFFPDARLNFAENLLRGDGDGDAHRLPRRGQGRAPAVAGTSCARSSRACSRRCGRAGVGAGDRVAAMLPNMPEAVAVMLAAASLGAIFSSCSPDFGERGVLDRFGQIEPKLFVAVRRLLVQRQGDRGRGASSQAIAARAAERAARSSSSPISAAPKRWRRHSARR